MHDKLSANDRFEALAALFYNDTGLLAPGKDSSPFVEEDKESRLHRALTYDSWLKSGEALESALRLLHIAYEKNCGCL